MKSLFVRKIFRGAEKIFLIPDAKTVLLVFYVMNGPDSVAVFLSQVYLIDLDSYIIYEDLSIH